MMPNRTGIVSPTEVKNIYRACVLRWTSVKQSTNKFLAGVIEEENFNFRAYTCSYKDPNSTNYMVS